MDLMRDYNIGSSGDETIAGAKGDPIMENDTLFELLPTSSRSYSFGSSGNEHYNFDSHHQEQNSNYKSPSSYFVAAIWKKDVT